MKATWTSDDAPSLTKISLILHAVGVPVLVFIAIASAFGWGDLYRWTADAQTLTLARPWDGAVSHLGMVVWSSATAISIFVALTYRRPEDRQLSIFLLYGAVVTGVLLADDLFMIHDELLPNEVGIPELVAVVGVALFPVAYLVAFRRTIFDRTPWQLLALAVAYLAVMVAFDVVEHEIAIPAHHLWEEGAKFLGILHWCGYLITVSWLVARDRVSPREGA